MHLRVCLNRRLHRGSQSATVPEHFLEVQYLRHLKNQIPQMLGIAIKLFGESPVKSLKAPHRWSPKMASSESAKVIVI